MEVAFSGLSCTLPFSKRKLLHDVSGRFPPGELTAILGPSGAGKSTLLNSLSGYKKRGVTGHVLAGTPRSRCYIGQEDFLAPFLTAGELMEFASKLKMPSACTPKQRAIRVEELLSSLGIENTVHTRTEELSGGQKKRLSVALELISNPPILFLDEPTSGLDIVSAGLLIRLLSKLSHEGRTIVLTIHQPSAAILRLFDRVYFLAGGRCVYQGGPGFHLVQFLAKNNFICPTHYNPADYLIELIEEDKKNIRTLSDASENGRLSWYSKEADRASIRGSFNDGLTGNRILTLTDDSLIYENGSSASFWLQFYSILSRIILQHKRNPTGLKLQFLHYFLCALLICIMFYKTGNDGSEFIAQLKLCISIILFHSYTREMGPCIYYPFEVKLLKREHFNQWYSLLPYYLAFKLSKLPYMAFLVTMYTFMIYTLSGLPWELHRFGFFLLVSFITSMAAEALGLTIGSLFNGTNGCIIGSMFLTPFLGLAIYGYDFMRSVPEYMKLLVRTSFMRSGVFTLAITVYGMDRKMLDCPEEMGHCHYRDPRIALHFLNLDGVSHWEPFTDLVITTIFFWITFYLALKWRLRSL